MTETQQTEMAEIALELLSRVILDQEGHHQAETLELQAQLEEIAIEMAVKIVMITTVIQEMDDQAHAQLKLALLEQVVVLQPAIHVMKYEVMAKSWD